MTPTPDKTEALIQRVIQERAKYSDFAHQQVEFMNTTMGLFNERVLDLIELSGREALLPADLKPALDQRLGRTPAPAPAPINLGPLPEGNLPPQAG